MNNGKLLSCILSICCIGGLANAAAPIHNTVSVETSDNQTVPLTREQLFALIIESRTIRNILFDINPNSFKISLEDLEKLIGEERPLAMNAIINESVEALPPIPVDLTFIAFNRMALYAKLLYEIRTNSTQNKQLSQQLQDSIRHIKIKDELIELLLATELLDLENPLVMHTLVDRIAAYIETTYLPLLKNNLTPVCKSIANEVLSHLTTHSAQLVIAKFCEHNRQWIRHDRIGYDAKICDFSPDGKLLAICNESGEIIILDHLHNHVLGSSSYNGLLARTIYGCKFSPKGDFLATASADKKIRLFDSRTYKQLGPDLEGHPNAINGLGQLAFNHDGSVLASGGNDCLICLWDTDHHTKIGDPLQVDNHVVSMQFSTDGKRLAVADYHRIYLWDIATRTNLWSTQTNHDEHRNRISNIAFSPDQTKITAIYRNGTITNFDSKTGMQCETLIEGTPRENGSPCIKYLPNGTLLALLKNNTVVLLNPETGAPLQEPLISYATLNHQQHLGNRWTTISVSGDGHHIAVGRGTIFSWSCNETLIQILKRLSGQHAYCTLRKLFEPYLA